MALAWITSLAQIAARLIVEIAMLLAAILLAIVVFALAVVRSILWIVNRLLPWLLRVACVAVWVYGIYAAFAGAASVYAEMADTAGKVLLGVAVVVLVIASPLIVVMKDKARVWAGFVFGGGIGILVLVAGRVLVGQTALYPAVGALPPVLTGVLLVYLTVKYKLRRERNVGSECVGQTDAA